MLGGPNEASPTTAGQTILGHGLNTDETRKGQTNPTICRNARNKKPTIAYLPTLALLGLLVTIFSWMLTILLWAGRFITNGQWPGDIKLKVCNALSVGTTAFMLGYGFGALRRNRRPPGAKLALLEPRRYGLSYWSSQSDRSGRGRYGDRRSFPHGTVASNCPESTGVLTRVKRPSGVALTRAPTAGSSLPEGEGTGRGGQSVSSAAGPGCETGVFEFTFIAGLIDSKWMLAPGECDEPVTVSAKKRPFVRRCVLGSMMFTLSPF